MSETSAFCTDRQVCWYTVSPVSSVTLCTDLSFFSPRAARASATHCYTWPDATIDPLDDTLTHLAVCLQRMTSQLGPELIFQEWKASFCADRRHSGGPQRNWRSLTQNSQGTYDTDKRKCNEEIKVNKVIQLAMGSSETLALSLSGNAGHIHVWVSQVGQNLQSTGKDTESGD